MPEPLDKVLYEKIKKLASEKFQAKTGIYRSSWIVKEYVKAGGKYSKDSSDDSKGLNRWFKEKWVNLNDPVKDSKGKVIGYKPCGRKKINPKDTYPLCRPTIRVNVMTPKTVGELNSKSIALAKKQKAVIKGKGNIRFK
jgi:hypothetical protein